MCRKEKAPFRALNSIPLLGAVQKPIYKKKTTEKLHLALISTDLTQNLYSSVLERIYCYSTTAIFREVYTLYKLQFVGQVPAVLTK